MTLVLSNECKEKTKKYEKLWNKVRDLNRSITKNSGDDDEKYMKVKFNSDDKLPLNKAIEIPSMIVVVRAVFHENNKYYLQVFLDARLIELMFLKELMLIKQGNQKSALFVTIGIFYIKALSFNKTSGVDAMNY